MYNLNITHSETEEQILLNTTENNLCFHLNSSRLFPNNFNHDTENYFDKSLSVSHINIRSLYKNFDSLQELYEDVFKGRFNFIGLSEIWSVRDVNQFKISDYNLELQCRTNQRGGGVGAYIHSSLNYARIHDLSLVNAESLWLKVHIDNKTIILGVIYRKPGTNFIDFSNEFDNLLQTINLDRNQCIIMGDFNINLISREDHGNDLLRLTETYGLLQLIMTPTRITNTSSTLIDHIYTNISSYCIQSGCIEAGISDHLPVYAVFKKFKCVSQPEKTILCRNFHTFSVDSFCDDLASIQWREVYECTEPNDAYSKFHNIFLEICDKHAPIEEKTIGKSKKRNNPWITKSIKRSIRKKHTLYSKTLKSGFDKVHVDKYKKYRNTLTSVVRTAKKSYYGKLFEKDKNNSKKTWDHINDLLDGRKSAHKEFKIDKIEYELDGKQNEMTLSEDIANALNDFYVNIGKRLANNIQESNVNYTEYLNEHKNNTFFLVPLTSIEVKKVIRSIDQSKAAGYDSIPARLLVHAVDYICEPLTHIFNVSITTGIFPKDLKIARVIPIYKKGIKTSPGNYRPISILPVISKVFEKLVNARLMKFLESNHILSEQQYGFRHGYSTKLSLINLTNQITKLTDEGRVTAGIFIDFAKAFDTIDHTILLNKMYHYGVRGLPLDWFKSYLNNRYQFVCYDGMKSTLKEIICGVPQGSVLGPTLFLLYINDLPNSSSYFKFRLFADDSSLFRTFDKGENKIDLGEVSRNLTDVATWCKANKLTINESKTKYMLFRNKGRYVTTQGQLQINGTILSLVDATIFIGLNIDEKLNWEKHINYVSNIISKKIGILYRIRHFVTRNTLIMLYNAFILPHITYGLEVWGAAHKTFLNKVMVLQKKITRIICFKSYNYHTAPLFYDLTILDVYKLYRLLIATFVHDLINDKLPHNFIDYFTYVSHHYETRAKGNYNISLIDIRTNLGKQTVSFSGAQIWNTVPKELRNVISRKKFRQIFKKELLEG